MKPMLAATIENVNALRFPLFASPKVDGVRGLIIEGVLRSRSMKTFPNAHVQAMFSNDLLNGLDGELIVGAPNAKDVYRVTQSAVANQRGTPDVTLYVFDDYADGRAFIVKDLVSGVEFNIGTGFTMADRELFWSAKQRVLGMVVKYKSFLIGVKDAPRFPVYLGMRNSWDM
jgi:hypothetical protein